jgi:hypothetical protein
VLCGWSGCHLELAWPRAFFIFLCHKFNFVRGDYQNKNILYWPGSQLPLATWLIAAAQLPATWRMASSSTFTADCGIVILKKCRLGRVRLTNNRLMWGVQRAVCGAKLPNIYRKITSKIGHVTASLGGCRKQNFGRLVTCIWPLENTSRTNIRPIREPFTNRFGGHIMHNVLQFSSISSLPTLSWTTLSLSNPWHQLELLVLLMYVPKIMGRYGIIIATFFF